MKEEAKTTTVRAEITGGNDCEQKALTSRIEAAINACLGIPIKALENGIVAELLAACEGVLRNHDSHLGRDNEPDWLVAVRQAVEKTMEAK